MLDGLNSTVVDMESRQGRYDEVMVWTLLVRPKRMDLVSKVAAA
jgi:hypothetical protein